NLKILTCVIHMAKNLGTILSFTFSPFLPPIPLFFFFFFFFFFSKQLASISNRDQFAHCYC
ncbi:hypothetical protein K7X86_00615, partial [Candidatus Sulcia muelleri]|nr:hypothetical protein [Candidatus Karelsulcia muelleri]